MQSEDFNKNGPRLSLEPLSTLLHQKNIIDSIEKVPDDLYPFPDLKPHPLKGSRKGDWALEITGNWRITFNFDTDTASAYDIDLEDYH
jgi:proteic killer suppression protein